MNINISTIPIYLITIKTATQNHKKLQSIFDKHSLNVEYIYGEILDKTNLSFMEIQTQKSSLVAKAHIEALKKTKPPFLILEDDVNITNNFTKEFNIPDDADAFYLGTSVWGMLNGNSVGGGSRGQKINHNFSKVWGMLGIHSVIYITENYVNTTIKNLENCIEINRYCDECIAEDMINHKVYCVNNPIFYQDDGHNNAVTSVPFGVYLS
jgi:hypothetical protein